MIVLELAMVIKYCLFCTYKNAVIKIVYTSLEDIY
jgi:hypothetical protein